MEFHNSNKTKNLQNLLVQLMISYFRQVESTTVISAASRVGVWRRAVNVRVCVIWTVLNLHWLACQRDGLVPTVWQTR